LSNPGHTPNS